MSNTNQSPVTDQKELAYAQGLSYQKTWDTPYPQEYCVDHDSGYIYAKLWDYSKGGYSFVRFEIPEEEWDSLDELVDLLDR